jgi:hypothetical protein
VIYWRALQARDKGDYPNHIANIGANQNRFMATK